MRQADKNPVTLSPATHAIREEDLDHACRVLHDGGVVAYPTEAVYGLGCAPDNPDALQALIALKGRDADKGIILIADTFSRLARYVGELPAAVRERVSEPQEPPTTWIVPASMVVDPLLSGHRPSLAIRVSVHPAVVALCQRYGGPLTSTSANPSGQEPARDASQVRSLFPTGLGAVVDGRVGELKRPTRIIDALSEKVLRP